ncbi:hypothetical protein Tco_0118331, partial [Tanacetum coccineum]
VLRTDRLIGGSAVGSSTSGSADGSTTNGFTDGSSTSGSADRSLGSGPKLTRVWALPWPVIDRFSQKAQVIMWPKPRGLVYPLYVINTVGEDSPVEEVSASTKKSSKRHQKRTVEMTIKVPGAFHRA